MRPFAVILAAGRGRRLGPDFDGKPKILLEFAGKTLLQRHLEMLERFEIGPVSLVVGYRGEAIEAELARIGRLQSVRLIDNPDWEQGSVVSLDCAADILQRGAPVLLMDGDVLYDHRLLQSLLRSPHACVLLLDRDIEPGDEPVKICVAGDARIVDFAKLPEVAGDWHGESVGFFRLSASVAAQLAASTRATIEAGARAAEYEEPLGALIRADARDAAFGFEDITGLPWTEIDFVADIDRARTLLPELAA